MSNERITPPLKCPDCPGNESFVKVRISRSHIDPKGKKPTGADPASIETYYCCGNCDDIVRREESRYHRSIKWRKGRGNPSAESRWSEMHPKELESMLLNLFDGDEVAVLKEVSKRRVFTNCCVYSYTGLGDDGPHIPPVPDPPPPKPQPKPK